MKAKYLVSMLALPALLAACVNDDFETQKSSSIIDNDLLKGRETGEVVLTATKAVVGDDAQTRIVGGMTETGGIEWKWEGKDDKIGAVVVNLNPANYNEIVSYEENPAYALTNYPFAPDIDGPAAEANFSTPTAVVKGAYVFYNRYDGDTEEGVSRRVIGHSIKEYINVDDGFEAGLQQVGTAKGYGQNFFISPIVDLAVKDGEQMELPVVMKSLYHVLNFNLTAEIADDKYYDKDGNFKIYKVEIEPANPNDKFYRSFVLDPAKLAEVQKEVAEANPGMEAFMPNGVIEATGENNEAVYEAMMGVWNKLSDPTTEIGKFTDESTKLIYQMTDPATFKKSNKGETINLMIVLPAGVYAKNTTAEKRDGKEYGCLKVSMYTSEGVYKCYAGSGDSFTARRGLISNVTRTLKIGGGETNIDLYDFTGKGFDVKTTEDWNYAIEYINNQYRDFSEGSTWRTPKLNLENYDGKDIEVNREHYFPDYPVIYRGDANLKLVGQKEYTIDPTKVIFANGSGENARPTIKIEDAEASVKFVGDVKKDNTLGTDGTHYTAAIKLISDATIIIAEDQEVNFEQLLSNTALNIAKGGKVNVEKVDGVTTMTDGTVTLAEGNDEKAGAIFNVNGDYQNDGTLTIGKLATMNQRAGGGINTQNNGVIIVDGELNVNWLMNNEGAELTVEAWDVEMDNKMSGKATIPALTNFGTIVLKARKQDASGTYGGELIVASKLDNRADITVQGRMEVENMANTGIITLSEGEYKYAWIQIKQGESTGDGKIVLANPADYEFYDRYFSGEQNLSDVKGVIEATLDADTYAKVLANFGETSLGSQERAWNVINKVIVKGELPLKAETGNVNKDFFLSEGATLNAQADLTLNSLTTEGAATLTAKDANTVVTVEKNVNVAATTSLTVAEKVKLALNYGNGNVMLNVAGTLTNNGWIESADDNDNTITFDPEFVTAQKGVIYANIETGATLKNLGKLSRKSEAKYSKEKDPAYGRLENLVELLYRGVDKTLGDFAGTFGNGPRVEVMDHSVGNLETSGKFSTTEDAWKATINHDGRAVTKDVLLNLLANGKEVTISQDGQSYSALAVQFSSSYPNHSYVLYLPEGFDSIEGIVGLTDDARQTACDIEDGTLETMPYLAKTWFYVENAGVLNLSESVWAYGHLKQMTEDAGLFGDFTNK